MESVWVVVTGIFGEGVTICGVYTNLHSAQIRAREVADEENCNEKTLTENGMDRWNDGGGFRYVEIEPHIVRD